jgi:uncharacterized protein (TIGR02271 family)
MAQGYQYRQGADVYSSDGQKIGDIADVGSNYLHVSTGFLGLGGDLYIPFSAVSRVEDDKVYLNVSKDRVTSMGWTEKPAERVEAGAAPTYVGTMPAATERGPMVVPLPERLSGFDVYSSDNKEIGKIYDQGPNYAHVRTGLFGLGGELYIPLAAFDHCTADRCYLKIPADQIHTMGWNRMPSEQAAAAYRAPAAPVAAQPMAAGAPPTHEAEEVRRIPLRDEELEVRKHREKVGEVIISKKVVEEQRSLDVPVTREEVSIERRMVNEPAQGEIPKAGEQEVLRVPIYQDVIEVERRPHVHEELVVSPEDVTTQQHITQTVHREVPEVETTGEARKFVHEETAPPEEKKEQRRQAR